ncbi:hypothetical protein AL755_10070 [Arthrobacter sp. ERGS1:01]|uniref:hypothetical protein n=1 Tax=Arthrobacter sp. ERGS1:01 TaxID=1704044 RepID=UPI0006B5C59B|nr:hypothetical protein [Arthrobacter sp. ERGS1:01]ALE05734.1 hypothetical protein AL755_10070 [Arthrobacter sp. ERGS1:01]
MNDRNPTDPEQPVNPEPLVPEPSPADPDPMEPDGPDDPGPKPGTVPPPDPFLPTAPPVI